MGLVQQQEQDSRAKRVVVTSSTPLLVFAAVAVLSLVSFIGAHSTHRFSVHLWTIKEPVQQRQPNQHHRALNGQGNPSNTSANTSKAAVPYPSTPRILGSNATDIKQLYNRIKWPSKAAGPSQILVMGYYHSGASLVTRLMMLLGVYAGRPEHLLVDASNELRWWELERAVILHDLVLRRHSSPEHAEWSAGGFDANAILEGSDVESEAIQAQVQGVLGYLNPQRPWVLKDPRLSWLAPLYLRHLENPVCLVMYRHPQELISRLLKHPSDLDSLRASPQLHIERWMNATLSALKACVGVPTLLLPSSLLTLPTLEPFTAMLHIQLRAMGVAGVSLPAFSVFRSEILDHFPFSSLIGGTNHATYVDSDTSELRDLSWAWRYDFGSATEVELPPTAETLAEAIIFNMVEMMPVPPSRYAYDQVARKVLMYYYQAMNGKLGRGEADHVHGLADHLAEVFRSFAGGDVGDDEGDEPSALGGNDDARFSGSSSGGGGGDGSVITSEGDEDEGNEVSVDEELAALDAAGGGGLLGDGSASRNAFNGVHAVLPQRTRSSGSGSSSGSDAPRDRKRAPPAHDSGQRKRDDGPTRELPARDGGGSSRSPSVQDSADAGDEIVDA